MVNLYQDDAGLLWFYSCFALLGRAPVLESLDALVQVFTCLTYEAHWWPTMDILINEGGWTPDYVDTADKEQVDGYLAHLLDKIEKRHAEIERMQAQAKGAGTGRRR